MNMIKEADTQTSLTGKVWNMGEQLFSSSILDQFINSHEQSYEEFLNSFTYLSKEEEGKKTQGGKVGSFRKTFLPSELSARNEQDGSPGRSKEMWESLPAEPKEKETVMNESWKAAGSGGDYLSLPEGVKQVAKCGDVEDARVCEGTCSAGSFVLPGEVEQTVTYCTPFFEKPIQQKLRTMSVPQPAGSKAQELLGDDVQPFSLDEEFDYDNVALTPKFSEAELKAILELSEEKKTKTDVKSA